MNRVRFFIAILITLVTALILQYVKVIDFVPEIFWINTREEVLNLEKAISTVDPDELPAEYDTYYVIYSSDTPRHNNAYYHLTQIFRNAHIHYHPIDVLEDDTTEQLESIPPLSSIIIANEVTEELDDTQLGILAQLVEDGSYLSIIVRSYDQRLQELCGFSNLDGFVEHAGLIFTKEIFPGLDDMELPPKMVSSSSLKLTVNPEAEILATDKEGTPIIWTNRYGKGTVFFSNSTLFQDKLNRGLLLQYILSNGRYGLATSFNKKIFNIDDFPAPVPLGRDPSIYADYQRDTLKFYKEIWWSDIRDMTARYDLKPTGLIIGTYNSDTEPPFEPLSEQDLETIDYLGRKLNEVDGELGIHGYNHNSMVLEGEIDFDHYGYNPWPSVDAMVEALRYLKSELDKKFGDISYRTYVAPSNIASLATKQAVKRAFPELKVFAGIYTGSRKVDKAFLQEVGPDPDIPGTYDFPRFSSGYLYTHKSMWNIYNGIAELGMFNHFIHPDDLLDPERSKGHDWNDLSKGLEKILDETAKRFPYLEPATDYEAALEYEYYSNMRMFSKLTDNTLHIWLTDALMPMYCYLRVDRPIIDIDGAKPHPLGRDGLYMLEIEKPYVTLKLLP